MFGAFCFSTFAMSILITPLSFIGDTVCFRLQMYKKCVNLKLSFARSSYEYMVCLKNNSLDVGFLPHFYYLSSVLILIGVISCYIGFYVIYSSCF